MAYLQRYQTLLMNLLEERVVFFSANKQQEPKCNIREFEKQRWPTLLAPDSKLRGRTCLFVSHLLLLLNFSGVFVSLVYLFLMRTF